jgi:hypothetical protein
MPKLDTTLKKYVPQRISSGVCTGNGCTYTFNLKTDCYDLQTMNCGPCSCAPAICGGEAILLAIIYPESVTSAAAGPAIPIPWSCSANQAFRETYKTYLTSLLTGLTDAVVFWKGVSIGLAIVSLLSLAGLVYALFFR